MFCNHAVPRASQTNKRAQHVNKNSENSVKKTPTCLHRALSKHVPLKDYSLYNLDDRHEGPFHGCRVRRVARASEGSSQTRLRRCLRRYCARIASAHLDEGSSIDLHIKLVDCRAYKCPLTARKDSRSTRMDHKPRADNQVLLSVYSAQYRVYIHISKIPPEVYIKVSRTDP